MLFNLHYFFHRRYCFTFKLYIYSIVFSRFCYIFPFPFYFLSVSIFSHFLYIFRVLSTVELSSRSLGQHLPWMNQPRRAWRSYYTLLITTTTTFENVSNHSSRNYSSSLVRLSSHTGSLCNSWVPSLPPSLPPPFPSGMETISNISTVSTFSGAVMILEWVTYRLDICKQKSATAVFGQKIRQKNTCFASFAISQKSA